MNKIDEPKDNKTVEDMGQDYINKLSNLLTEIDEWQKRESDGIFYFDIENNCNCIVVKKLDNALDRLYTKLYPKMKCNKMQDQIIEIDNINKKISSLKNKILHWGNKMDMEGDIVPYYEVTPNYKIYRDLITLKQNILNEVLETKGLTSRDIEKGRRFG